MMYELWHVPSGNLLEDFETESDALDAVRGYVEANGPEMVRELSLGAVPTDASEDPDTLPPTLTGETLARRLPGIRTSTSGRTDSGENSSGGNAAAGAAGAIMGLVAPSDHRQ